MTLEHRDLLAVGRVRKAFGIKGEIIVAPMTDFPDRFRKLENAYIGRSSADARPVSLDHVSVEPRGVRVKLAGIDSRNEAEKIVGLLVFVDSARRVQLEKGRYFIHDLIGLTVIDQKGNSIGTLKNVLKLPAQDVYLVERNGREIMLPAVKEFVTSVDVDGGTISVRLIDGMLDEQ